MTWMYLLLPAPPIIIAIWETTDGKTCPGKLAPQLSHILCFVSRPRLATLQTSNLRGHLVSASILIPFLYAICTATKWERQNATPSQKFAVRFGPFLWLVIFVWPKLQHSVKKTYRLLKASHAHLHEHKHEREPEREQAHAMYHV